jgi:hypothetical protein
LGVYLTKASAIFRPRREAQGMSESIWSQPGEAFIADLGSQTHITRIEIVPKWEPIETAPTHQPVLIWQSGRRPIVAWKPLPDEEWTLFMTPFRLSTLGQYAPTHWFPLSALQTPDQ